MTLAKKGLELVAVWDRTVTPEGGTQPSTVNTERPEVLPSVKTEEALKNARVTILDDVASRVHQI